jgi:hypothetical protein
MTNLRKRIAIVLPSLAVGGAEWVNVLLSAQFIARGFAVDFALMRSEGELLADLPRNVRVIDLHATRMRDVPVAFARYLRSE